MQICTFDGCTSPARPGPQRRRCELHAKQRGVLPPKACEVEGCERAPYTRRWLTFETAAWLCMAHCARKTLRGDVMDDVPVGDRRSPGEVDHTCTFPGCEAQARRLRRPDGYSDYQHRCEDHAGRVMPVPQCGMPGCDSPVVVRQPSGKRSKRCAAHRGQVPPNHRELILAGRANA